MKESSEDMIIKNIKEVLEQYEPDYSPQFWENLSKQRPVPESRLKSLLLKYKFWLSCLTIAGVLLIVYKDTDVLPADKYPAIDPQFPESSYHIPSEKPKEIAYPEKIPALRVSMVNTRIREDGKSTLPKIMTALVTDSLSAIYQNDPDTDNPIMVMPFSTEQNTVITNLLEEIKVGGEYQVPKLIPMKYEVAEIPVLRSPSSEKTRKLKLQWPGSLGTEQGSYDRFKGPNRLVFFYSPEIHYSDSLSKLGVSQGFGISFEGSIRSSVSVSAGLSYQSMNFNVTISSVKIPPDGPFQPADTNQTIYNVDSIDIRGGSYKFLELPVAVNFKFLESPRSQLWLSAGISAIAFLKQDYTYETRVGGISDSSSVAVKAWENIHPLASFNIGLLYRYELSDKFFLHGEAQYKQHLVPLGYNSMKLNRLNFQAGIVYRFGH
jgi:hypothetical protein